LPRRIGESPNKKRHPTIEDDAIIYSNATVLGGRPSSEPVRDRGNVWITDSVPRYRGVSKKAGTRAEGKTIK